MRSGSSSPGLGKGPFKTFSFKRVSFNSGRVIANVKIFKSEMNSKSACGFGYFVASFHFNKITRCDLFRSW